MKETPDNLISTSYAQVLDLISEGEIVGLVDGAKSIYLNDTPVQNADGSYNFTVANYVATTGTQTQGAIAGFDETTNEIGVNVEVKASTGAVTRNITNSSVTSVGITLQFPSMTQQTDKGDINGSSVSIAIDYAVNGGSWVTAATDTISGKTTSPYERQYRINLPAGTTRSIRVRRTSADSTSSLINNKSYWKSYTEVVDAKLRYPNSAMVALKFDSANFSSIPTRGYDVKLLKVKIPTNATVRTDGSLTYSGTWDGSFKVAWTTCPAWCYYDLITNTRYGLGNYIDASQVDKWALYTISKYCNELISNGLGGTEPRFSCNMIINSRQEAYTVLNQMTSIFRGIAFWSSGSITAVQDAPKDPVYLFTNSNVVSGTFNYQGSSAKARHTVALVTWNDPSDMCRQKVEYVEDTDGIARYGIIEAEVVAVGCTSRGQANRVGRWLLYSERFETEVITFKTGGEGAMVVPGDIIKVADSARAQNRTGGRISSATSTSITVDALGTVPAGTKTLYVVGPDGITQTRTVSSISGKTINVTAAFTSIPQAQSGWAMAGTSSTDVQTYRVVSPSETDDGEYEVSALEYDVSKHALIESNLKLTDRVYTDLNPAPDTPTGLTLTETTYAFQNTTRSKVYAQWVEAANASSYLVQWRVDSGNFTEATVTSNAYEILDTIVGTYEVRVTAHNASGVPSGGYASATLTTVGNSAAPVAVSDLTATSVLNGISLKWTTGADALWQTEIYENTTNNSATATLLTTVSANSYTRTGLAASDGARWYWVKLVNTSGGKSAFSNVATATATSPATTSGLTLVLSVYTIALPAYSNGSVLSYGIAVGQATVYSGTTDVTASATLNAVATNVTGSINTAANTPVSGQPKGYYQVTAMTADTGTLKITATYNGASVSETFTVQRIIGGPEIVSALPTTNLFEGRVVFLTTDDKLYRYVTGTGWTTAVPAVDISGTIASTQITDGAISTPKLAANAVTAAKIAASTITSNEIASNAVTADKILAGAVTAAKINVTQLSAITATIGTLRTATTGARTEISDNVIKVYDAANTLRVKIGDLSL